MFVVDWLAATFARVGVCVDEDTFAHAVICGAAAAHAVPTLEACVERWPHTWRRPGVAASAVEAAIGMCRRGGTQRVLAWIVAHGDAPPSAWHGMRSHPLETLASGRAWGTLRWAVRMGVAVTPLAACVVGVAAARHGCLPMCVWAWGHRQVPDLARDIIIHAADGGHAHIVGWMLDTRPLPASDLEGAVWAAVHGGHCDVLHVLHAHGAHVSSRVAVCAAERGDIATLEWMLATGCRMPSRGHLVHAALRERRMAVVEWAHANLRDDGPLGVVRGLRVCANTHDNVRGHDNTDDDDDGGSMDERDMDADDDDSVGAEMVADTA